MKPPALLRPIAEADAVKKLGRAVNRTLGTRFSLVTWNMSKARHADFFDDVADVAAHADVVLLQEAVLHGDQAHTFHDESGFEWVMGQNFRHRTKAITTGVKTGSRAPSTWHAMLRSTDREPFIRSHKSALATMYDLTKGKPALLVLNIHAINFVGTRKYKRQMTEVVKLIQAHKGPLIVAGDFNSWGPLRRRILSQAAQDLGLVRAPVAARKLRHFNQVLDHIFYRGLELLASKSMRHIRSSDHTPLWTEFQVQKDV